MRTNSEAAYTETVSTPRNSNYRVLPIIYRSIVLMLLNALSTVFYLVCTASAGIHSADEIVYPQIILPASLIVAQLYLWLLDSSARARDPKASQ